MDKTPEKEHVYKSSIQYTITENQNGGWRIDYESTIENDIAAMSIAQYLLEDAVAGISLEKRNSTNTRDRRSLSTILDKAAAARFGLKLVLDKMQPIYHEYKAKLKNHEENKPQ